MTVMSVCSSSHFVMTSPSSSRSRAFVAEKTLMPSNFDSPLAIQQPPLPRVYTKSRGFAQKGGRHNAYTVRRKRCDVAEVPVLDAPLSSLSVGSVSRIWRETSRYRRNE